MKLLLTRAIQVGYSYGKKQASEWAAVCLDRSGDSQQSDKITLRTDLTNAFGHMITELHNQGAMSR